LKRSSAGKRREFAQRHGDVALPPDDIAYDAYGFLDWEQYWSSGLETAQYLAGLLAEAFPDRAPRRLLEWGCGPARIVRHLAPLLTSFGWSVLGSDYNAATVRWCRDNIGNVSFAQNDLDPPLPFEAASFDAVYCISVFTHLSEARQLAWSKEIARVLKSGG